ncbi:MAG: phospholipase [bacterium]|nr:phospholipase [bacterium]
MTTPVPRHGQRVAAAGASLAGARAAMVLLHGRGAPAEDMLGLAGELGMADVAFLAPEADGFTWYPNTFLAPLERNEPWLSAALETVARVLEDVAGGGVPIERTLLLGFSQGACLATEFTARNPRPFGGVIGLTGGLIGPPGTPRDYPGSLAGVPVFLGCSDVDPHIPLERVDETADVLGRMGATVDKRIYPGLPHTVNRDELDAVRALVLAAADRA